MQRISKLIKRHRQANWTLADQSVVSGSNFITGILLARFLGPEAFGLFVLLQSVLLYVNSFPGSLLFLPMMSAAPQLADAERQQYLQGVFALQLMLSLGLAAITGVLALFADALFGFDGLRPSVIMALIAALIGFQLQDWQRRYYFVQEHTRAACFNDIISYGGQTVLLLLAGVSNHLNVANAFSIIAATSFIAFIVGYSSDRLAPIFVHARSVLIDGWRTGRDYFVAWQFQWLGSQGVFMVGAGVVGTQGVGGVRATQSMVGPITIMFQAMENFVPIKAARHYSTAGMPGLLNFLWRITLLGTLLLVPLLLLVCLFARPLIHLLYGEQYLAFATLIYWQAAYIVIQFYQRISFFFLRTVKATSIVLRCGILMAVFSLAVAAFSVHRYQELGLIMATLSGTSIALIYSLIAARKLSRDLITPATTQAIITPELRPQSPHGEQA